MIFTTGLLGSMIGFALAALEIWWLWRRLPPRPLFFWGGHAAMSLIIAVALAWGSHFNRRLDFWLYLAFTFFVPVYGALGSSLITFYRALRPLDCAVAAEYADYLRPDAEIKVAETPRSVEQMVRHELNIQSYFDIMRAHDRALKKALIRRIMEEWTPRAVDLLKIALLDDEYEIRSFASTALSTLENQFSRRLLALQAQVMAAADEARGEARLKLARAYLAYLTSGLLDASAKNHYRRLVLETLEEAAADRLSEAEELNRRLLQAQCERESGRFAATRTAYQAALELNPRHEEALAGICAMDFALADYRTLQEDCARLLDVAPAEHPAAAAAMLWLGVKPSARPREAT